MFMLFRIHGYLNTHTHTQHKRGIIMDVRDIEWDGGGAGQEQIGRRWDEMRWEEMRWDQAFVTAVV